jgi:hypothetical protein
MVLSIPATVTVVLAQRIISPTFTPSRVTKHLAQFAIDA